MRSTRDNLSERVEEPFGTRDLHRSFLFEIKNGGIGSVKGQKVGNIRMSSISREVQWSGVLSL